MKKLKIYRLCSKDGSSKFIPVKSVEDLNIKQGEYAQRVSPK